MKGIVLFLAALLVVENVLMISFQRHIFHDDAVGNAAAWLFLLVKLAKWPTLFALFLVVSRYDPPSIRKVVTDIKRSFYRDPPNLN